jgi:hypothetical protein
MPYSIGDILLKVDDRAYSATIYTRHHVMLVIGENESGAPIVMHMLGAPHYKLVKEELNRGKDLIKIHYLWPELTREAIAQAADSSLKNDNFVLTKEVIEDQCKSVSIYRPTSSIDEAVKLAKLRKVFTNSKGTSKFTPTPDSATVISCHEWVLNIIHYACQKTSYEIPTGLQIPPDLAWADRLNCSAKSDPEISYTVLAHPKPQPSPTSLSRSASLITSQAKDDEKEKPVSEQTATTSLLNQIPFYSFVYSFFASEKEKPSLASDSNRPSVIIL